MTEEQFWKTTPRKLNELFSVHMKIHGGKSEPKKAYIDQVL